MLLNPVITQINKYSFLIKDSTTAQMYTEAGVDLSTVTSATVTFKKAYLPTTTYTITIGTDFQYILGDGLTINITDFPDNLVYDQDHIPDWMYTISVIYTYNSRDYTKTRTVGFREVISAIVFAQLQQSDWVKELSCGCEKYSLSMRKFNYLRGLEIASDQCLIMQYQEILMALYKITGTTHEYSS